MAITWSSLPLYARNEILKLLPALDWKCSQLTTVCREWQSVLEPLNLANITLTAPRLAEPFTQAILSRASLRKHIRYIWFRIELKQYDCDQYFDKEELCMDDVDNQFIVDAFQSLFTTLSTWEPSGTLALDISVYSPSDNKHWFKYLTFRPDTDGNNRLEMASPADDEAHGWAGGQQHLAPEERAIEHTFEEIMGEGPFDDEPPEMDWWRSLPSVPAVGVVLLRQQTRRRWKPVALANMLTRFPNMTELCWEPWKDGSMQLHTDTRTQTLIESFASTKLRKLTIFEHSNDWYTCRFFQGSPTRVLRPELSRKLAQASLKLDTLSASFMTDAGLFFAARQDSWTWEKLTSLALTSKILTEEAKASDISQMLQDAAAAALEMPKLQTMELWNGKKGEAILFRYQRAQAGQQAATITIRGSSVFALESATMQAWNMVSRRQSNVDVVVQTELLNQTIRCHADAVSHLGLLTEVARPVSLRQIVDENEYRASASTPANHRTGQRLLASKTQQQQQQQRKPILTLGSPSSAAQDSLLDALNSKNSLARHSSPTTLAHSTSCTCPTPCDSTSSTP
ncbi:hypothetical protein F5X68DRAFT_220863 [Plectosphaerella plurivora]|uniref:DUF6546 domain-containing protein n=1 Tax=Plectosphaerella plurivora TaxID=936078 RepID=A0A9P8VIL5_9PEZI|nr:hypothetical protein F5X68DRAFT_220863 [Plectosphaerella plurivora]